MTFSLYTGRGMIRAVALAPDEEVEVVTGMDPVDKLCGMNWIELL